MTERTCKLAILVVTANFLASDFIQDVEVEQRRRGPMCGGSVQAHR